MPNLHNLKPKHKRKDKKRKGRGKKYGMYSGRGIKGQKARAGHKLQPVIRRFVKRYPKKRGYRFSSQGRKPEVVNVSTLEKQFEQGAEVTPQKLVKKGVIEKKANRMPKVKILGKGKISKKLTIKNMEVSSGAEEKIKKAGGEITET